MTRNLTLHYDRMMLLLDPTPLARGLAGKKVEVVNYPDGRFAVQFNGTALDFKVSTRSRQSSPARSSTTIGCQPCWSRSRCSRPPIRCVSSEGTLRGGDRRTTSRRRVCRRRGGHQTVLPRLRPEATDRDRGLIATAALVFRYVTDLTPARPAIIAPWRGYGENGFFRDREIYPDA